MNLEAMAAINHARRLGRWHLLNPNMPTRKLDAGTARPTANKVAWAGIGIGTQVITDGVMDETCCHEMTPF
jgi:hypothetical protein